VKKFAGGLLTLKPVSVAVVAEEVGLAFDPGQNSADLEVLQPLAKER
jgi:hypothetical protein